MQYRSMTSITIRNVPDEVRDELAARARLSGRSLQEYLRSELIRLASQTVASRGWCNNDTGRGSCWGR
jgi:plasmid stability protein